MSAEYILAGGNSNVILCERGIRTFETYTRNTLDISAVPVLKELTHLPVIIDPSHASGMARLVKPLSLAAVAAGADGLIIEVHNDPAHALCDDPQSLTPEAFDELMTQIRTLLRFDPSAKIRKAAPSMNIGIIGLGLIGGSMAKAIKAYRNDVIFGADHNEDVIVKPCLTASLQESSTKKRFPNVISSLSQSIPKRQWHISPLSPLRFGKRPWW